MLKIFKSVNSTPLLYPPICLLFFTGKFIFINIELNIKYYINLNIFNIKFIELYKACSAKESTELSISR